MIALARLPLARLLRTRRAWAACLWWLVFALGAVLIARHARAASADVALLEVFLPFVLPLVVYAIVSAVLAGEGVMGSVDPLVVLGARPSASAFAAALVASVASAMVSIVLALLLLAAAHAATDPPLAHDLQVTAYAAGLAGAAHGAFLCLGSVFGAAGRSVFLLFNWLLGASHGWVGAMVPYAHARSLLGGAPAVESLGERASAWCLVGILAVSLALVALRGGLSRAYR